MQPIKFRSGSVLNLLSHDDLAALYDWVVATRSYTQVQARALRPPPEGFGLHIQITTLRRFYQQYTAWLRIQELEPGQYLPNPDQIKAQSEEEMSRVMHDVAHSLSSAAEIKLVASFLEKQRQDTLKQGFLQLARQQAEFTRQRIELERERMAEQRRQWEFNVGRELMKSYLEYDKIHRKPGIDDEEKIWQAREIAFGKPAARIPSSTAPAQNQPALGGSSGKSDTL